MNFSLLTIVLTPFVGGILSYLGGKIGRSVRQILGIIFSLVTLIETFLYRNAVIHRLPLSGFLQSTQTLMINPLSSFISICIAAISLIAILASLSEEEENHSNDFHYLLILFACGASLGAIFAGDILTFAIFTGFLLLILYILLMENSQDRELMTLYAVSTAIVFSLLLFSVLLISHLSGSLSIQAFQGVLQEDAPTSLIFLITLFWSIALLLSSGAMPFQRLFLTMERIKQASIKIEIKETLRIISMYLFLSFLIKATGTRSESYIIQFIKIISSISLILETVKSITDTENSIAYLGIYQIILITMSACFISQTGVSIPLYILISYVTSSTLIALSQRFAGRVHSIVGIIGIVTGALIAIRVPVLLGFDASLQLIHLLVAEHEYFALFSLLSGIGGSVILTYSIIRSFIALCKKISKRVKLTETIMLIAIISISVLLNLQIGPVDGIITGINEFAGFKPARYSGSPNWVLIPLLMGLIASIVLFEILPRSYRYRIPEALKDLNLTKFEVKFTERLRQGLELLEVLYTYRGKTIVIYVISLICSIALFTILMLR